MPTCQANAHLTGPGRGSRSWWNPGANTQLPDRSASDLVRPMPDVQLNRSSDLDNQADHKGALDHVPLHWRRAAGTDDLVPAMPPPYTPHRASGH